MTDDVTLREVQDADRDVFYSFMQDEDAIHMAAFTPEDPADRTEFDAHWNRILGNDDVTMRTILRDGAVVGNVGSYSMDGDREVTYWVDKDAWGTGIATTALGQFLLIDAARPIHARVVQDNAASIKVLERSGFVITGEDEAFAPGRGEIVAEYIMTLPT